MSQVLWLILVVWVFCLGAAVGSFLNVVIHRLPRGKSIVNPPSHCPHCESLIRWYDNIPILSWFLLRGRCRDCRRPISLRYPVVEAATAAVITAVFWASALPGRDLPHASWPPTLSWANLLDARAATLTAAEPPHWLVVVMRSFEFGLLLCTLLAATVIAAEGQKVPGSLFLPLFLLGLILWLVLPWLPEFGIFRSPDPIEAIFAAGASVLAAGFVAFLSAWFWGPEPRRGFIPAMYTTGLLLGAPRTLVVGSGALVAFTLARIFSMWFPRLGQIPLVAWLFVGVLLVGLFW